MSDVVIVRALKRAETAAALKIRSSLSKMPLRVRNHRAERYRLRKIEAVLVRHASWASVGRPPGKARGFSTDELGCALAKAGLLEDMALRQTWGRLKAFLGGSLDLT
jgi:hypothetical protein